MGGSNDPTDVIRRRRQVAESTSKPNVVIARRYALEARLGAGGMGVVWRAHDTILGRRVALKLLHDAVAADAGRRARFHREARAAAAVSDPRIATVFDVGEADDGTLFIAMELVDGQDLRQRLRTGGPLAEGEVARIGREVAAALSRAHAAGIVHRDIKPENVMIDVEGRVKVLDFGVARPLAEPALTADGFAPGTKGYMAPEQREGAVTPQSDIYAAGVLLHELVTGVRPLEGVNGPSGPLGDVIARCLAPLAERYSDGAALVAALQAVPAAASLAAVSNTVALADAPGSPVGLATEVATAATAAPRRITRRPRVRVVAAAVMVLVVVPAVVMALYALVMFASGRASISSIPQLYRFDRETQAVFTNAVIDVYAWELDRAAQSLAALVEYGDADPRLLALYAVVAERRPTSRVPPPTPDELRAAIAGRDDRTARIVNVVADALTEKRSATPATLARLRSLVDEDPDDYFGNVLLDLADAATYPAGDHADRLRVLDTLIAADPWRALPYYGKGFVEFMNGDAEAARVTVRVGLAHVRNNASLRYLNAELLFDAGQHAEARRLLEALLAERPDHRNARALLLGIVVENGDEDATARQVAALRSGALASEAAAAILFTHALHLASLGRLREADQAVHEVWAEWRDGGKVDFLVDGLAAWLWIDEVLERDASTIVSRIDALAADPALDEDARRRLLIARVLSDAHAGRRPLDDAVRTLAPLPDSGFLRPARRDAHVNTLAALGAARRGDTADADRGLAAAQAADPTVLGEITRAGLIARALPAPERLDALLQREGACRSDEIRAAPSMAANAVANGLCRLPLAWAAVTRAEQLVAVGNRDGARRELDRLRRLWPRPDDDLPIAGRARAVASALAAP